MQLPSNLAQTFAIEHLTNERLLADCSRRFNSQLLAVQNLGCTHIVGNVILQCPELLASTHAIR